MENCEIKLINISKIDYVRVYNIENYSLVRQKNEVYLTTVQIFQNGKKIFEYDFKTKVKADSFCDKMQHTFKENLLFDPIKVIQTNNL